MQIPASLYIHIPWCVKKCPYCDFNSHKAGPDLPEKAYIQALLKDLDQALPALGKRPIESLFIGGGTPSLFSAQSLDQLLQGVFSRIPSRADIEITLEANPGTFEYQKFCDYRKIGINRLSIGVQSLQNDKLKALGRIHQKEEAIQAVAQAKRAGFDNFNLDLMHGLPGQTEQEAMADLKQALALEPTHLSWYQLTIEPNTVFWRKPPKLPDEDRLHHINQQGHQLLKAQGYQQYEVSAYSQAKKQCQHNLNYWSFGDFIGIGAGAHSKISALKNQQLTIKRDWKTRQPDAYLRRKKNYLAGEKNLEYDELPIEFMLNTLRLSQGFPLRWYKERTGSSQEQIEPALKIALEKKLIHYQDNWVKPTALGSCYLNNLLEIFMS